MGIDLSTPVPAQYVLLTFPPSSSTLPQYPHPHSPSGPVPISLSLGLPPHSPQAPKIHLLTLHPIPLPHCPIPFSLLGLWSGCSIAQQRGSRWGLMTKSPPDSPRSVPIDPWLSGRGRTRRADGRWSTGMEWRHSFSHGCLTQMTFSDYHFVLYSMVPASNHPSRL